MFWIILGIYILCGVLAYGVSFAYLQKEYTNITKKCYKEEMEASVLIGFFGFFGLVAALAIFGLAKHGVKFK